MVGKATRPERRNNIDKFYQRVEMIPFHSCYLWTKATTANPYGSFSINNRTYHAARAAWILERGPIPKGMHVCHKCDNPPCVRIDHLFLGNNADNMRDMWSKKRRLRIKDMSAEDRDKWRETKQAYASKYREDNRESLRAKGREYCKRNRQRMNAYKNAWRARRKALGLEAA